MPNVFDEIDRLQSTSQALALLERAGVSRAHLLASCDVAGAFGLDRVEGLPDGTYQPAEDGLAVVVFAVRDCDGWPIDLVAFDPAKPGRWRCRFGYAAFLGEAALAEAAFKHEPIRFQLDPLAWLQRASSGAVLLDGTRDVRADLIGVAAIEAADRDLGERLARRLDECARLAVPPVMVPA